MQTIPDATASERKTKDDVWTITAVSGPASEEVYLICLSSLSVFPRVDQSVSQSVSQSTLSNRFCVAAFAFDSERNAFDESQESWRNFFPQIVTIEKRWLLLFAVEAGRWMALFGTTREGGAPCWQVRLPRMVATFSTHSVRIGGSSEKSICSKLPREDCLQPTLWEQSDSDSDSDSELLFSALINATRQPVDVRLRSCVSIRNSYSMPSFVSSPFARSAAPEKWC